MISDSRRENKKESGGGNGVAVESRVILNHSEIQFRLCVILSNYRRIYGIVRRILSSPRGGLGKVMRFGQFYYFHGGLYCTLYNSKSNNNF